MNYDNKLNYQKGYKMYNENLAIVRLAPGIGKIEVEWRDFSSNARQDDCRYYMCFSDRDNVRDFVIHPLDKKKKNQTFDGFADGKEYSAFLVKEYDGLMKEKSHERIFRTGFAPGKVINYIHPNDLAYSLSGLFPASPSIVRAPSGALLVSHDIFGTGNYLSKIFRSMDEGRTWEFVTDLFPCFWGKLFSHGSDIYILAVSREYGDLIVAKSQDEGATWSKPAVICKGEPDELFGCHRAPMPVVSHKGRLWASLEYGSWQKKRFDNAVVSVPEDADLLDASNWTVTPFLRYDKDWPGTAYGGTMPCFIEGNILTAPDGSLVNFLRYNTRGAEPDYGLAGVLKVDADNPSAQLSFGKTVSFHGNLSKFVIHYDAKRKCYLSLVNKVTKTDEPHMQRNILTLVKSDDMEHWEIVDDLLNFEDIKWHEDYKKTGFQYVDWLLEGDKILAVSRTAINGADTYHNNNHITYHEFDLNLYRSLSPSGDNKRKLCELKEFIFGDDRPFLNCHAVTLAELRSGETLAAWFGGTKEKNPDVAIWSSRRKNGKWSCPEKIADEEGLAHWNPVLFNAPDGRIFLYYKTGENVENWRTLYCVSDDDGYSWTAPGEAVAGDVGGRGPVKNKPIVLQDGTWIAPASVEYEKKWDSFADISKDGGKTWLKSALVPIDHSEFSGEGIIQPTLWETEPGMLHMLLRSSCGKIMRSDSRDGGGTWSAAYETSLPNNNSGLDAVKLKNGVIALVYNPVGGNWGKRTPLCLSFSFDNAVTWPKTYILEDEEGEFSYPAIVAHGDRVSIAYTWKRERIAYLNFFADEFI